MTKSCKLVIYQSKIIVMVTVSNLKKRPVACFALLFQSFIKEKLEPEVWQKRKKCKKKIKASILFYSEK